MNSLKKFYKEEIVKRLREEFKYQNIHAVPRLEKVVLNIGASKAQKDPKYLEVMEDVLLRITGQRPVKTKAKQSISNFKIRQGMVIGFKVTLRGDRMYDFVQKLVCITLPRVRDFRGLSVRSFDGRGNYCIGFREYLPFPEIKSDEVEKLHGLEVAFSTTARTDAEGHLLLRLLGFPFREDESLTKTGK